MQRKVGQNEVKVINCEKKDDFNNNCRVKPVSN